MKTSGLRFPLFVANSFLILCLLGTGVASAGNLFSGPINSPAGRYPYALAAGDFNHDGKVDLAVTRNNTETNVNAQVKILLGEGTGIFQVPVGYPVGAAPNSVAVGDFNRDGDLDLAVISFGDSRKALGVLLGNGDGTFQPQVRWNVGLSPVQVTVGDFNADGKLDLAVLNIGTPGFVSILLGNGDGIFQPKTKTKVTHYPAHMVAGDLNGDGLLDLVTTSGGCCPKKYTYAFLGNGDGTFTLAWTVINQAQQFALALGDFNGDGKLDLAVTDGRLGIRLGKGDGTFGKRVNYPVTGGARSIAIDDYDGDGDLDVAVTSGSAVSVLLDKGDGTFGPPSSYPLTPVAIPVEMVAADVNGDNRVDLVVTDYFNEVVSVLVNTGRR